MIKISLLLCLTAFLQLSSSLELKCAYNRDYDYSILGKIYRCDIQNEFEVASQDDVVIDSISGQHHAYVGHRNVTGLYAYSKDLKFMPQHVEKFFENIKLLDIVNSRIRKIHQSDLKPYSKLIYCGFKDNEIQVLETGLFDYNLELQLVSFWNNRVIQVGPNVFDHLTKLAWLYMNDNTCMNQIVENNRVGVLNMIEKISQNCNSLNCSNSEASNKEIEELKSQFKAHENELKAMTITTEDLAEKNQKLEKDLNEALGKIKDLETKISNIEVGVQKMNNNLDTSKNVIAQQVNQSVE